MPDQDQPGVHKPEHPPPAQPPPPGSVPAAAIALVSEVATFLALTAGRVDLAFWAAVVGLVATIVLLLLLLRGQDVAPLVGPIPGPPPRLPAALALVFAAATFLALLSDRPGLAHALSVVAAIAAGVTLVLLLRGRGAPAARPGARR
ncbi:MAG TPA: hypothetical protein VN493_29935 [Thermoanaerobaculia bacterium]|nr:hypothetical protein [Thermoanaerobaculia bacterium]